MSLMPPELRVLCSKLSSIPTLELPRHLPTLLHYVQGCQALLSSAAGSTGKSDPSSALVLLHRLKTQLSALLGGRTSEARFTAAILIKAVAEVGGWEVLQSSEPWVRGLLNILAKQDPPVVKEMCVLALTKIYLMTQQYQTLVREITTPTLPGYVTSCLSFLSPKATSKGFDVPSSLVESIFRSFAMLIPRYTSIFRPFTSQIRFAIRPYLAPNLQEKNFISSDLKEAARQLSITLYQAAAKNNGGEEWVRAVRELVKDIHVTADKVFRAIIEDWESNSGYVGELVGMNNEPNGGKGPEDLPHWTGIDTGTDRLIDLLELLAEHFRIDSPGLVAVPLGSIMDLCSRMLLIVIPSVSGSDSANGDMRVHPAISREERDELWARMNCIYVAALQLVSAIAERLKESFVSIAPVFFDQLAWIFPYGKHVEDFRLVSFDVTAKILQSIGSSLERPHVGKLATIIRACCQDLCPEEEPHKNILGVAGQIKNYFGSRNTSSDNADSYLQSLVSGPSSLTFKDSALQASATRLLPLMISYIPQQHLDISLRSLIERTAILSRNKAAMLASILHPFVAKNGKAMPSILPHLTSAFGSDELVEILLRPRMPVLSRANTWRALEIPTNEDPRHEDMDFQPEAGPAEAILDAPTANPLQLALTPSLPVANLTDVNQIRRIHKSAFERHETSSSIISAGFTFTEPIIGATVQHLGPTKAEANIEMAAGEISDDESVHLTMQLDTESEGDDE